MAWAMARPQSQSVAALAGQRGMVEAAKPAILFAMNPNA
jgi:hypothetical protein